VPTPRRGHFFWVPKRTPGCGCNRLLETKACLINRFAQVALAKEFWDVDTRGGLFNGKYSVIPWGGWFRPVV
jgi:hypothetical protein